MRNTFLVRLTGITPLLNLQAHLPCSEACNVLLYHVLCNADQTKVIGGTKHSKKVAGPRKADTWQDEETCIVRASSTSALP